MCMKTGAQKCTYIPKVKELKADCGGCQVVLLRSPSIVLLTAHLEGMQSRDRVQWFSPFSVCLSCTEPCSFLVKLTSHDAAKQDYKSSIIST